MELSPIQVLFAMFGAALGILVDGFITVILGVIIGIILGAFIK